jgi:hypothetical protein
MPSHKWILLGLLVFSSAQALSQNLAKIYLRDTSSALSFLVGMLAQRKELPKKDQIAGLSLIVKDKQSGRVLATGAYPKL